MGSDISKTFGIDLLKKKGGLFGINGLKKTEMHNMKIVLRGMNGVGKTSLFDIFQGKPCPEKYIQSKEINTTHVLWTNPATKERVTIEIWDVVDKAEIQEKDQVKIDKISEYTKKGSVTSGSYVFEGVDACNVNVYQGCHACLFIVDPRNTESIEYFKQHVESVPSHIPILVIANFRDVYDDWKMSSEDIQNVIENYVYITPKADETVSDIKEQELHDHRDNGESTVTNDVHVDSSIDYTVMTPEGEATNQNGAKSPDTSFFKTSAGEFYAGKRRVISYIETSFLEKFGLHSIYLFLGIPFFILELAQLQAQLVLTLENLQLTDNQFQSYIKTSTYDDFLEKRRLYEEKLLEEERLRRIEEEKKVNQAEESKNEQKPSEGDKQKDGKMRDFFNRKQKGNRIHNDDNKKSYATIKKEEEDKTKLSDSENEMESSCIQEDVSIQTVEDFYNDDKAEKDLSTTVHNMELEELVHEDSNHHLTHYHTKHQSSSSSLIYHDNRERSDSFVVNELESDDGHQSSVTSSTTTPTPSNREDTEVSLELLNELRVKRQKEMREGITAMNLMSSSQPANLTYSLSSRSLVSNDDESDTNSVVYNKSGVIVSPQEDIDVSPIEDTTKEEEKEKEKEIDKDKDKTKEKCKDKTKKKEKEELTPCLPDAFCEEYSTRFSVKKEKNKTVSVSAMLKNVWNRMNDGENKDNEEEKKKKKEEKKKKKDGEDKMKFKLKASNRSKDEEKKDDEHITSPSTEHSTSADHTTTSETDPQTNRKAKWELDQCVMAPVKRMLNSLKTNQMKNHITTKEANETDKDKEGKKENNGKDKEGKKENGGKDKEGKKENNGKDKEGKKENNGKDKDNSEKEKEGKKDVEEKEKEEEERESTNQVAETTKNDVKQQE